MVAPITCWWAASTPVTSPCCPAPQLQSMSDSVDRLPPTVGILELWQFPDVLMCQRVINTAKASGVYQQSVCSCLGVVGWLYVVRCVHMCMFATMSRIIILNLRICSWMHFLYFYFHQLYTIYEASWNEQLLKLLNFWITRSRKLEFPSFSPNHHQILFQIVGTQMLIKLPSNSIHVLPSIKASIYPINVNEITLGKHIPEVLWQIRRRFYGYKLGSFTLQMPCKCRARLTVFTSNFSCVLLTSKYLF